MVACISIVSEGMYLLVNSVFPINTHTNPPGIFSGHKIMWNLMCATYLWIDRSIDWLIEWVSEWVSNWWCDRLAVWLSLKSNSFYTLLSNNLSKLWHIVTRYPLSLYQSWFIIEWQSVSLFKEKLTKDISLKSNRSSKSLQRLLKGGYVTICFLGDLQIVNRSK